MNFTSIESMKFKKNFNKNFQMSESHVSNFNIRKFSSKMLKSIFFLFGPIKKWIVINFLCGNFMIPMFYQKRVRFCKIGL